MPDQEYEGWKNYETWCVALWINNDQGTQETVLDMARACKGNKGIVASVNQSHYDLSHQLKDWIEEQNPLADSASMFSDLLNAALSEVDWYELAESFLQDIKEEE